MIPFVPPHFSPPSQRLTFFRSQFFLVLHQYLQTNAVPTEFRESAQSLVKKEGTLFDGPQRVFEALALRADELIVRHVVREVLGEMKAYLARFVFSFRLSWMIG